MHDRGTFTMFGICAASLVLTSLANAVATVWVKSLRPCTTHARLKWGLFALCRRAREASPCRPLQILAREIKCNEDTRAWAKTHNTLLACTLLLSILIGPSAIPFLSCKAAGSLSAPFSERSQYLGRVLVSCSILLEDVPQFVIQATFGINDNFDQLIVVSLLASNLTIVFGISRKILDVFVTKADKTSINRDTLSVDGARRPIVVAAVSGVVGALCGIAVGFAANR